MKQLTNLPGLMKMKDKYFLYARKSTESEDRQVASIENQLNVLYQFAESKGISIAQTFSESKSAKKPGRDQFNLMVDTIRSRNDIRGIISWKLNRLSRNPQDSGVIQQLLYDGTIEEIVTPSKTFTEADSDFVMAIENSQSQRFIRDLKEDTQRGIDKKNENGHAPILAPTGYRNDVEKRQGEKTISPHPVYFQLVRSLFELAMTGRFSTQELCNKANQMGIKNSRGRPVSKAQMYRILQNPFYTGRYVYGGVTYSGSHTPMISDKEFNIIQQNLSTRSKPRKQIHDYPLRGLVKCSKHNYYYVGERHVKKSGKVFTYYKCSRFGKGCKQPMVRAPELEQQVQSYLSKITIKKSYIDWATKWLRHSELQDREVRNKQHQALKLEYAASIRRLDNLTDKWLSLGNEDKSLLSDEEYRKLKQRYLYEKKSVYQRMKSLDHDIGQWTDTLVAVFNFTLDLKNKWEHGSIEDKQHILTVVGSELVMKDKTLFIKPRTPFRAMEKLSSNQANEAKLGTDQFQSLILGG